MTLLLLVPIASFAYDLAPIAFPNRPTAEDLVGCPLTTVELGFTGDAMVHDGELAAARRSDGTYAMPELFDGVSPFTREPDAMFANLETNVAGADLGGYSGYPAFNSPPAILDELKRAGVDVLQTANNHCLDRGILGGMRTLDRLDEYGFIHAGTARTVEERLRPVVLDLPGGLRVGYISYTFDTEVGRLPIADWFRVNYLNGAPFADDVARLRDAGADLVVVGLHWGVEYRDRPEAEQVAMARYLTETLGVDIVWGTHPHVVQPGEVREADAGYGRKKDALILYSLGNMVSNQRDYKRDGGAIVRVTVLRCADRDQTWLGDVRVTPTWVDTQLDDGTRRFRSRATPETSALCGPDGAARGDCAHMWAHRRHIASLFSDALITNSLGPPAWAVAAVAGVLSNPSDQRPKPYFTYYAPLGWPD